MTVGGTGWETVDPATRRTDAETVRRACPVTNALESKLRTMAGDPAVGEIPILAHAMRKWGTLAALRQMAIRDGRNVQEALSNVHRHAAAFRVIVDLRQTSDAIILCIADDGHGMPFRSAGPNGSKASLGVDIPGMRIRLRQFGGSPRIRSGKSATVIRAYGPRCGIIEPAHAVPMAAGSQLQPVKAKRHAGSGVSPSIPRDSPEFRE